jgi:hypothetical protein
MFRALDLWLPAWLNRELTPQSPFGIRHVMLCVCDHFEPFHDTEKAGALARMATWRREWPRLAGEFKDADGQPPKHTFFYPIEQYDSDVLETLAELCSASGSEAEIHLHHDRDTAENLRTTLLRGKDRLAGHGLLARDADGTVRYGFVHGNWALDDSHPHGRYCGVRGELAILRETGCYADFTLPSAPDRTQTRTINSLYYARSTPHRKSHDTGRRARADRDQKPPGDDELLIVQGPLGLNWKQRKFGVFPRIENGDLTPANPPTIDRLRLWMDCRIAVESRPNWTFIKLHTHGANERNSAMLLGEPMRAFHRALAEYAAADPSLHIHYVTAREMVNVIHAAEAGHSGEPHQFRDSRYTRTVPVPELRPPSPV